MVEILQVEKNLAWHVTAIDALAESYVSNLTGTPEKWPSCQSAQRKYYIAKYQTPDFLPVRPFAF